MAEPGSTAAGNETPDSLQSLPPEAKDAGSGSARASLSGDAVRRPSVYQGLRAYYKPAECEDHQPLAIDRSSSPDAEGGAEGDTMGSSAEEGSSAEGGHDDTSGPDVCRWLEHVNIRLKDPSDKDPVHLIFRQLQHNAFVIEEPMECDCQVGFSGPETEDLILRVFTGSDPRRAASFKYVGHIHTMQANDRHLTVKFRPKGTTYYLGVEVLSGLNTETLQTKSVQEVFQKHELLARDPQGLACATDCDFLVVWGDRDQSRNTAWIRHLAYLGPRRGPGDTGHRSLKLCTDWSLGMGQHFGTKLEMNLGRYGFGRPATEHNAKTWFDDLLSMSRLTRYGVLIVNVTPHYFRSRDSRQELFNADWARLFVYAHMEDCIIPAEDYAKQLAQDLHPIIPASEKGDYLEVVECLRNDVDCFTQVDKHGNTPLAINSMNGGADAIRQILHARADVEERNYLGVTSLHHAVVAGNLEATKHLIEARAIVDGRDDHLGLTPLHEAARLGRGPVVMMLMEKRADPRIRDNKGHTALAHAHLQGHMDVVNMLQLLGHWQDTGTA